MGRLAWSIVSLCVLLPAVRLHDRANAQRPAALRQPAHIGGWRWWFPWPRRAEFADERTWRQARLAQTVLHAWTALAVAVAVATFRSP